MLAALLFAGYAALSVSRHRRLQTSGYDLGIFEQAVRAYAWLRAPISPLKGPGFNLLGDHFHPILVTLAPMYRLFPSPITLQVAQAALLSCSAIPVTRLAIRVAGTVPGFVIGAGYGLSWGLQNAAGFDFHEICFAVPLLAFSLESLVRERWRAAVVWAAPLALVKEDMPITVAMIGIYLALHGRRRLGAAVTAAALAVVLLVIMVIIPALNPGGHFSYLSYAAGASQDPVTRLLTPSVKLHTLLLVLAPSALLALRSPIMIMALPTLAWRFWSNNPDHWRTNNHYSAVLMPVVFVAFVDGLARLRSRRPHLARPVTVAAATSCAMVTATLAPGLPLWDLTSVAWRPDPTATAARDVLRQIPDGAVVAADNWLAPQLTNRTTVYLFPQERAQGVRPEWIVTFAQPKAFPDPNLQAARLADLPAEGYTLVRQDDGVLLFRRTAGS
ncbi:DUF2079 domain-containing protein [Planosporangium thailandense]|uniref:DUF2079 domain-containing protein n=1 Tax=Planosporangium thailandense TaxID=765197 RepID=A0ABX0XUX7_9ACTN|nr:DUF2079 domain-containing protein [Planosporangium thailandense]